MSWFTYKNVHSDTMGIRVNVYPEIARAEQRVESVKIPGRSGELYLDGNRGVYESYMRPCVCTLLPGADAGAVVSWLTGAGDLVMGNEPQYAYAARVINSVPFERILRGRAHRRFEIPFWCQPYKKMAAQEDDIELTATGSIITNPGHVDSRPLVRVAGTGDITIMIGTATITGIKGLAEPILIDGDAGLAVNDSETMNMSYLVSGDWPRIPVGNQPVSWLGNVTKIIITPRWRYL